MKKYLLGLALISFISATGTFLWLKNSSGSFEYLIPLIEKALNPKGSDYQTTMQDIKLEWDKLWTWPKVKIYDVKTVHRDLGEVLKIKEVSVQIDLSAMIHRELQLRSIHIQDGLLNTQNIPRDTTNTEPWSRANLASLLSTQYNNLDSLIGVYHGLKYITIENLRMKMKDPQKNDWEVEVKSGRLELNFKDYLKKLSCESLIEIDQQEQAINIEVIKSSANQAPEWQIKSSQMQSKLIDHFIPPIDSVNYEGYFDVDLSCSIHDTTFLNPVMEIRSSDLTVEHQVFMDQPLKIKNLIISTRWNDQFVEAHIENSELEVDGQNISYQGKINPHNYDVNINLKHPNLTLAWLNKNWSPKLIPPARKWIFTQVEKGQVYESQISSSSNQLSANAKFTQLSVNPWKSVPLVKQAHGNIFWSMDSNEIHQISVQIDQARILKSRLESMQISLDLINHPTKNIQLGLNTKISGTLTDALHIIDKDILSTESLPAQVLSGRHQSSLSFKLDLGDEVSLDKINLHLKTNAQSAKIKLNDDYPIQSLSLPTFNLTILSTRLQAIGEGSAENHSFQFNYQMNINKKTSERSVLKIKANTHTKKMGRWFKQDILTGPIKIKAEVSLPHKDSDVTRLKLNASLNQAQIILGGKLLKAASNKKSTLEIKVTKRNDNVTLSEFNILGKELKLTAVGNLNLKNHYFDFKIEKLKSGVALLLHKTNIKRKNKHISLNGNFLNLHRFMRLDTLSPSAGLVGAELIDESAKSHLDNRIELNFSKIQMTPQGYLKNVKTKADWNKGTLKNLAMIAEFGKSGQGKKVNAKFLKQTKYPTIEIKTNDAGGFLREFEYYNHMYGGGLKVQLKAPKGFLIPRYRAEFQVKDFRIAEAPTLSKIVAIGSFIGIGDAFNGKGTRFHRAKGTADLHLGKIKVNPTYAQGPSVSIYTSGNVDTYAKSLQLQGNVIPFSSFNESLGLKFVVSDRPSLREPNIDVTKVSKVHSKVKAELKALERQQ